MAAQGNDLTATAGALIDEALGEMFSGDDAHRFLEVTYASGEKETLYFKDFVSGAMIESICTRAKKTAVKRMITTGVKGIGASDLVDAVKAEFRENEDLPNTTNPDDWAKIAGRRGERIVHVRPVFDREAEKVPQGREHQHGPLPLSPNPAFRIPRESSAARRGGERDLPCDDTSPH